MKESLTQKMKMIFLSRATKKPQLEPGILLANIMYLSGATVYTPDFKTIAGIVVLLLLLFISALMSGSEVAYFSLSPADISKLKSSKSKRSKGVLKLYSMPKKLLSTILVANNTINIAIVILASFISSRLFNFSNSPLFGFIIEVVVITFSFFLWGDNAKSICHKEYPFRSVNNVMAASDT